MSSVFAAASGVIDIEKEPILYLASQEYDTKKKSSFSTSFVATQYGAYWLVTTKQSKITDFHCWFDLRSFSRNGDSLAFQFEDPNPDGPLSAPRQLVSATYTGQNASEIFAVLRDYLVSVLDPFEVPEFSENGRRLTPSIDPRKFRPPLRYALYFRRTRELRRSAVPRATKHGVSLPKPKWPSEAKRAAFKTFVAGNPTKVPCDLMPGQLSVLLGCLGLMPGITTLTIPGQLKAEEQKVLGAFIIQNHTITEFEFRNGFPRLDPLIYPFTIRSQQRNNPVSSFVFASVPISSDQMQAIIHFVGPPGKPQVTRIDFHNSITADVTPTFLDICSRGVFEGLTDLSLDRCPGLNLDVLFGGIPTCKKLSVCECGLDISKIFEAIDVHQSFALTRLSVSGNSARLPFRDSLVLPPNLVSFDAANVQWDGDNFFRLWTVVLNCKSRPGFRAGLARAGLSSDQWQSFLGRLEVVDGESLAALDWSDNPVSPLFIRILASWEHLAALDISGSLVKGDSSIGPLVSFLRATTTLDELSLCGTDRGYLGLDDLRTICDGIQQNRSITKLLLCDHFAGPDLLLHLGGVLMNNLRIKELHIEGNDLYNLDVFRRVLVIWQNRGAPLSIPWPEEEVGHVLRENPAMSAKLPELRLLFDAVRRGNLVVRPVEESAQETGPALPGFGFDALLPGGRMAPAPDAAAATVTDITDLLAYAPEVTADQLEIPAWIAHSGDTPHECS
jgi:hypothetical protein